ncbi:putative amidohydrolase YtcJ [Nocardioides sp. BE266]|uniref:amidohydrolase n=1 Tax=Nocardioides sp. BE266 TaxID=2817725 RepID=UPI0028663182|nr:amidohydrolase [Nocardioides sp. BE266]MDR7251507.1 putative amidohydrolase YtcJ [Nocardioides sp. BE266]
MTEPTPRSPLTSAALSRRAVVAGAGLAAGAVAAPAAVAASPRTGRTARVVVRGHVFSGTSQRGAEAVAIGTDGRIQAVGSTREIRRMADRRTEVVDASGGTIMAGFHDGHMHPLGAAEQSMNPSLGNATTTVPQLQATLQGFLDASADHESDGWLQVTDWNPVGLLPAGTTAHRSMLDALRTARPMLLQGSDFHNAWVNSRALALAGVDRTTPDPAGGEIVRDGAGEPTGLLKDTAQDLVRNVIPPPVEAELQAAYADTMAYLLSLGITSFMDAASDEESLKAYARLRSSGRLLQQVTPALRLSNAHTVHPAAAADYLHDLRRRYGDVPGMHVTTTKVFVDGVIEFPAQTAALLSPYLDEDGRPTKHRGDLYLTSEQYQRLAVVLDKSGWQMHSHAIGDAAVRVALDGYEAAYRANPRRARQHRHTIAHLQLVHPDDYPRFARLGVLACMQLQWAVRNVWTLDALRPFIGEERFRRMYPAGSLQRAGAHLVGGSDWPVDPLRPFNQVATAMDRTMRSAVPKPLNATEGLSREAALLMHTSASAFQLHEGTRGVVAPGRVADLVVVDRDLERSNSRAIRQASVRTTLVKGAVVYDADSASGRAVARRGAGLAAVAGGRAPHACCG